MAIHYHRSLAKDSHSDSRSAFLPMNKFRGFYGLTPMQRRPAANKGFLSLAAHILRCDLPAATWQYEVVKEPHWANVESFQLLSFSAQPYNWSIRVAGTQCQCDLHPHI